MLFLSIAFYCGKAQEIFVGVPKNIIEKYFSKEDIKYEPLESGGYVMTVIPKPGNHNILKFDFIIDKNSGTCNFLVFYPLDCIAKIDKLNKELGAPTNGFWVGVNPFGEKVKIEFKKSSESFWYTPLL